jgi:hypothetical protein
MQIEDLFDLAGWIRDEVEQKDIISQYNQLQKAVNQAA